LTSNVETHAITTTGKGGVQAMITYPAISKVSENIHALALPSFSKVRSVKKAAVMKPMALVMKISETIA
jgi:hypothetical protein